MYLYEKRKICGGFIKIPRKENKIVDQAMEKCYNRDTLRRKDSTIGYVRWKERKN